MAGSCVLGRRPSRPSSRTRASPRPGRSPAGEGSPGRHSGVGERVRHAARLAADGAPFRDGRLGEALGGSWPQVSSGSLSSSASSRSRWPEGSLSRDRPDPRRGAPRARSSSRWRDRAPLLLQGRHARLGRLRRGLPLIASPTLPAIPLLPARVILAEGAPRPGSSGSSVLSSLDAGRARRDGRGGLRRLHDRHGGSGVTIIASEVSSTHPPRRRLPEGFSLGSSPRPGASVFSSLRASGDPLQRRRVGPADSLYIAGSSRASCSSSSSRGTASESGVA